MNEKLEFLLDQIIRLQNKIEDLEEEKEALNANNKQLLDDRHRYMMKLAEAVQLFCEIKDDDGSRYNRPSYYFKCVNFVNKLEDK
jgi:uncharacterized protein (UPF0335 family)